MNIKNQILDAIDDINLITSECEYNTICEMYNSYDKASMILEYYEGDNVDAFNVFDDVDNFYQESSVSDKMKKSGAKYNTFMKIITFIPRLVKALLQTISEKFKKIKPSKELQKAPKEVKEKLTTVFDKKKDKKKRIATVASLILGAGAVGVATKVGVDNLSDVDDVEKKAEKIVNIVDNNLDDINKRYKNLVNKLYSHDSMPLPPEDKQSVGVKFDGKYIRLCDNSEVGRISDECLRAALYGINNILRALAGYHPGLLIEGQEIDHSIKEVNKSLERFNNRVKEEYNRCNKYDDSNIYYVQDYDYITDLEDIVKNNWGGCIDKFNKRSDEDKELLMTQTTQNFIKTLNDEVNFYQGIFYDFLSLYCEFTKLIDDVYRRLRVKSKVKVSDKYKFDEHAERLSKFKLDIPSMIN